MRHPGAQVRWAQNCAVQPFGMQGATGFCSPLGRADPVLWLGLSLGLRLRASDCCQGLQWLLSVYQEMAGGMPLLLPPEVVQSSPAVEEQ